MSKTTFLVATRKVWADAAAILTRFGVGEIQRDAMLKSRAWAFGRTPKPYQVACVYLTNVMDDIRDRFTHEGN